MIILNYHDDKVYEYTIREKQNIVINGVEFCIIENRCYYYKLDGTIKEVKRNEFSKIENEYYLLYDEVYYQYKHNRKIVFSPIGDIKTQLYFEIDNKELLNPYGCVLYINGKSFNDNLFAINDGDAIVANDLVFSVFGNFITFLGNKVETSFDFIKAVEKFNTEYQKSPRMFKQFESCQVDINTPSGSEKMNKNTIAKIIIPSLISILTTILIAIFTRRGLFVLVGIIATLCSLTYSISTFFQEKKQTAKDNAKRRNDYIKYLSSLSKKLKKLYDNEKEVYNYNYPSVKEISEMIEAQSSRIYERDYLDDDFLTVSMGYTNQIPHYKLKEVNFDIGNEDELNTFAQELYNEYRTIKDIKYHIELAKNHVGLIGDTDLAHAEIKRIILELCLFQSYHDLNIILLYHPQYAREFTFANWLKHCRFEDLNVTTNISTDSVKEQVLGSFYQISKQRQRELLENKKDTTFRPHYLFYIDDYNLIVNHPIMEFLQSDLDLGITIIVRVNQYADLSSNIKTVFMLKDDYNIDLLMEGGIEQQRRLKKDKSLNPVDYDGLARSLASFDHKLTLASSIPETVTFLEMYNVDNVSDLNIKQRWDRANIHKSISVPLGLRGPNDIVNLNLHEKAHGPHGLVAGTTGSGKSEIIQAYILSLVVNFSPYEVGFLLIDFKGGGMANLFKDLPHLIGTITNLDGAESMRALASIKSELSKRQRIFNEHNVNNINLYNKLFKAGKATEPLPHLFIISDEFAELKKEQPDFMDELISVARIGRTLGVHLILATQKPSGVVNDQIWSNSKFKLALKVQNESDSKEIIKTPDAAFITQTGRAYLQVGNNEIYELFQSAWSGAPYLPEQDEGDLVDENVYVINKLGQEELLNDQDEEIEDSALIPTQLDAVIEEVKCVYDNSDFVEVEKAWKPSLEPLIVNPNIVDYDVIDLSTINDIDLRCSVGLVDIPDKQDQRNYIIDFNEGSNFMLFGSSGYGKSFGLMSCVCDLAIKNNPELVNFYVIDLGNSGLIGLKNLVHVADYIGFDSLDKIPKLINRVNILMEERKQLLSDASAQNIGVYEEVLDNKLERVFIVLDNFDAAKETNEDLIKFIEIVSLNGPSLGIHLMISATRSSVVKMAILNNFKHKICLFTNDVSDMNMAVGRTTYPLNGNIKGRGLVKLNDTYQLQLYSICNFNNLGEFNATVKGLFDDIGDAFTGKRPKPIPVIPDKFGLNDLQEFDYQDINVKENIIGLSVSDVMQIGMKFIPSLLAIAGHSQSGKSNLMKNLIAQVNYKPYVIDSKNLGFIKFKDNDNVMYVNDQQGFSNFVDNITKLVEKRRTQAIELIAEGKIDSLTNYYNSLEERIVFIDDIDDFVNQYKDITKLVPIFEEGTEVGVKFVFGINGTESRAICKPDDDLMRMIKNVNNMVVVGKLSTYNPLMIQNKLFPKTGYGIVAINGSMIAVRIPYYESRKEYNECR